jgi:hypothetical protein
MRLAAWVSSLTAQTRLTIGQHVSILADSALKAHN